MTTIARSAGLSLGSRFTHIEADLEQFDVGVVLDILRQGHHDGAVVYVLRGAIPAEVCRAVHANFRSVIDADGTQREGFVQANQVGSTQFEKTGQPYAESTARVQPAMLRLFDGLSSTQTSQFVLDEHLRDAFLRRGVHFGPSRFKSIRGNYCTVRAWMESGQMSLQPHEDLSQVELARQDAYEIQTVEHTVSFNTCVARSGAGGELVVWDLLPSPELRRTLGVFDSGYPYPLDLVEEYPSLTLRLEPGDCYFLNASLVHGVRPSVGERVTAGRFLGATSEDRVVFWT